MALKNKKTTAKQRVALASRESLMEGAASMAGSINKGITKDVVNSLITGGIGEELVGKRKLKRRIEKKIKRKKPSITVDPKEIKKQILEDDKPAKADIQVGRPIAVGVKQKIENMKKDSTFKMKGFSGFGDGTSPAKKKEINYSDDGTKTVTRTRRDGSVRSKKVYDDYYGKTKLQSKTKYRKSGEVKRTKTKISDTTNKITKTNRKGVTKTMYRDNAKTKAKKLGKFTKNVVLPTAAETAVLGLVGGGLFKGAGMLAKTGLGRKALAGVAATSGVGLIGTAGEAIKYGAKAIGKGIKRIRTRRKNRRK